MAVQRILRRLQRLRELEEEQSRLELEAAVGNRNRVAQELAAAVQQQIQGRTDFVNGISEEDASGRTGAVIEIEQARRQRLRIEPRLEAADIEVAKQREEFMARRTGRQQVETLVDQERKTEREEAGRRAQQMLDDWYGRRGPKEGARGGNGMTSGTPAHPFNISRP
jgi:flagellar export protein FliJ